MSTLLSLLLISGNVTSIQIPTEPEDDVVLVCDYRIYYPETKESYKLACADCWIKRHDTPSGDTWLSLIETYSWVSGRTLFTCHDCHITPTRCSFQNGAWGAFKEDRGL